DYVAVLAETSMRGKRPLANRARIAEMLAGANFIVTARDDGNILGLARCISDGAWIAYCAELAVKESAQGRGIGAGLIRAAKDFLGPRIGLVLISEEEAVGFYTRIGMERIDRAFFITREDRT
ncbi:MAG TPA: GNAT family N-acetyltransferase, partial [Devosia sp.]|nr:GNAT family N-acetyltransferase [Devosia sp.]